MTPIEKVFRNVGDFLSGALGSFFDMLQNMNMIHLGVVSAFVLIIAAFCLRGTPTRGA